MTHEGACGLMGNMECESNCESMRVQGDFSPDRAVSQAYTYAVDNGVKSRDTFAKDSKGYGLCQWTYHTRKAGLLDYCAMKNLSVGDETSQVEYAIRELKMDYPALWQFLCNTDDMEKASDEICSRYERPAVNNFKARYEAAKKFQNLQYKAETPSDGDGSIEVEITVRKNGKVILHNISKE